MQCSICGCTLLSFHCYRLPVLLCVFFFAFFHISFEDKSKQCLPLPLWVCCHPFQVECLHRSDPPTCPPPLPIFRPEGSTGMTDLFTVFHGLFFFSSMAQCVCVFFSFTLCFVLLLFFCLFAAAFSFSLFTGERGPFTLLR